ncbi:uncharacterized protein MONBRDRAFT_29983 [Monosiga brevicollis MX1]|uniref:Uncharacterized protein n=1 Tax=Monosiga brevicollis TaxID=81824 RepID=A9VCP0_MONBE|nr:uncharacterized protein MONBRDRAFT_29983 [Monosiga brevicollis MX1]EDQ84719.1 predicted protein [Monosiga brevicollis MX1]|eukprot:XP_001750505.1 hypothetical protein [Monosiga brevicollis MX1]
MAVDMWQYLTAICSLAQQGGAKNQTGWLLILIECGRYRLLIEHGKQRRHELAISSALRILYELASKMRRDGPGLPATLDQDGQGNWQIELKDQRQRGCAVWVLLQAARGPTKHSQGKAYGGHGGMSELPIMRDAGPPSSMHRHSAGAKSGLALLELAALGRRHRQRDSQKEVIFDSQSAQLVDQMHQLPNMRCIATRLIDKPRRYKPAQEVHEKQLTSRQLAEASKAAGAAARAWSTDTDMLFNSAAVCGTGKR